MKHIVLCAALWPSGLLADPPDILSAEARQAGGGWAVSATIQHPDTGWDHYADAWRVELEDGTILGERVLLHPHVAEQPFTRSLSDIAIPAGTVQVFIRARCLVDGWGADRLVLPL